MSTKDAVETLMPAGAAIPNCKVCRQPVDRLEKADFWIELVCHAIGDKTPPKPDLERMNFCSAQCVVSYIAGYLAYAEERRARNEPQKGPHGPH